MWPVESVALKTQRHKLSSIFKIFILHIVTSRVSVRRPTAQNGAASRVSPTDRWNIDRRPDNSERRVLIQEPKYANRQITWGRVDCQSSINTHVIQLSGYSTLDGPRTEQTAEASLSVRDSERRNRREPSVQMSPFYGKPTAF